MAKGKKAAARKKSDKETVDASKASSNPKVSDEDKERLTSEVEDEENEIWDIVCVLPKDTDRVCHMEGCNKIAVVTWATNLEPEKPWDGCEKCQEKEFGGWPEGFHPEDNEPADASNNDSDPPNDDQEGTGDSTKADTESKDVSEPRVSSDTVEQPKDDTPGDGGKPLEPTATNEQDREEESTQKADSRPDEVTASEDDATPKPPGSDGEKIDTESNVSDSSKPSDSSKEVRDDAPQEESKEDEDGEDEVWDLKKVLSPFDLSKACTIKCSTEDCLLAACSIWISNNAPTTKWYSCMDCQEKDFEGWPNTPEELPITHMTVEHKELLAEKCSSQKAPSFPKLPSTGAHMSPKRADGATTSHTTLTPPPTSMQGKGGMGTTVTPSPAVLAESSSSRPTQQSKNLLKAHRKWQEAAEAMGGPDARIIVSKPAAKKLIFDMLYDAFCPMNITQIHKKLKAVVPSPILKSCLDDMADKADEGNPFDDSDSEDEDKENKKSKKKSEPSSDVPYAASLSFKEGRNANTCLYYVDHTKMKNNGNGLEPDERNSLASDIMQADAEEAGLKDNLKGIIAETTKLLSEPTNEEATASLEMEEGETSELLEKLEAARKLKVNEKHKVQTKKGIEYMTSHWRKRKRLCMDFLIAMEESTDGAVSLKRCLSGDMPGMFLDSDESVIEGAIAFAKRKRQKTGSKTVKKLGAKKNSSVKRNISAASGGIAADESFVGVLLDSSGKVLRAFSDGTTAKGSQEKQQLKGKPRTSHC